MLKDNMIFESHAHYDDEVFDPDRDQLLGQMHEHGISHIMNVGASLEGCRKTIELTEKYKDVYGAIGIHPDEVGELNEEAMKWLEQECTRDKIKAVGEIGLDYYWDKETHESQKEWFRRQLDLARKTKLPVIIHSRDAAQDTFDLLQEEHAGEIGGVIHCFSYGKELAKEYVKMGFYIGIGGVLTFKNAKKLKEVAEMIPLTSILLETDCPYLAPVPYRGKRNSSGYLTYVAEELARIKGISCKEVISQTAANAKELFVI